METGYWPLYRYNPTLTEDGKNPITLDFTEPTGNFAEFLKSEVRYSSLLKQFPETAEGLLEQAEKDAVNRLAHYKRLAQLY